MYSSGSRSLIPWHDDIGSVEDSHQLDMTNKGEGGKGAWSVQTVGKIWSRVSSTIHTVFFYPAFLTTENDTIIRKGAGFAASSLHM